MKQMTHSLPTLLGNLAVPITKVVVITLKEKYRERERERENWHAAWRLLVLRRLSLSGIEKGSATYLSTPTACLMAWPDVFVKICHTWMKSSGRCDRSSIQMSPRLFSTLFVLQPHTYFQDGLEAPVFRDSVRHRAVTSLCGTPAGHFVIPIQQKANLILQSDHSLLLMSLFWPRRDFLRAEKEGLKEQFLCRAFSWLPFSSTELYLHKMLFWRHIDIAL